MTTADKQKVFVENSLEVNTQSMADFLPGGDLFRAKNIQGSTLRSLLRAFSLELGRLEAKLQELADEYYIENTVNLIEEWERALSIPDSCFKVEGETIELRRKQVIAKLALMNVTTADDFVDLAAFFGVRVQIFNGVDFLNIFPLTFPVTFFNSEKEAKFTMIVFFPDIPSPSNVFPLTFPFTFDYDPTDFIMCLFERIKPAPVHLVKKYKGQVSLIQHLGLEDLSGSFLLEDNGFILLEDEL